MPEPAGAMSWNRRRRVCARIEATKPGLDSRFVVANSAAGPAEHIHATLHCGRGQMENLTGLHESQLQSERTSCRAPLANQVRLVLHTAAFWPMLTTRDEIPKTVPLAVAEFTTLREKLLKIGARIIETAGRVSIALATACPHASLFRPLAGALQPAGPRTAGPKPRNPSRGPLARSKCAAWTAKATHRTPAPGENKPVKSTQRPAAVIEKGQPSRQAQHSGQQSGRRTTARRYVAWPPFRRGAAAFL